MIRPRKRRGVLLLVAVIVTTVLSGLLTVLALNAAHFHRQRQADRVKLIAHSLVESAVSYVRAKTPEWSKALPQSPIELDVAALLPPKMTGAASLQFLSQDGHPVCRVSAQAGWGPYTAVREVDLPVREH